MRVDFFVNSCPLSAGALVHIYRELLCLERRWWTRPGSYPQRAFSLAGRLEPRFSAKDRRGGHSYRFRQSPAVNLGEGDAEGLSI